MANKKIKQLQTGSAHFNGYGAEVKFRFDGTPSVELDTPQTSTGWFTVEDLLEFSKLLKRTALALQEREDAQTILT